uniref:DUF3857 domain-containing protein n=1 Tax=Marinobacter nauticus TaxID=2743 RepID=A0A455WHA4_MARNT|nr:hypothetical protein YBY_27570 [Marinobacter nauticus]
MRWLLLAPFLVLSAGVWAKPSIQWNAPEFSALHELASELRGKDDLPSELTRLEFKTDIKVDKDTVRRRVRDVWYYPSSTDVQNNGTDRIYFDEQTDQVTIHLAASIDAKGRLHAFEADNLKITNVDNGNTFTDRRQAVIALPGLGAGSVAMLEYEIVTDRSRLEMGWTDIYSSQIMVPVSNWVLTVEWPKDEQVDWDVGGHWISCEGDDNGLSCSGADIPAVRFAGEVSWADEVDHLIVGEAKSWDAVIDRARSAFNQALTDTRGSDELLVELETGGLTQPEQIAGIHEFVARDIRYVSMSELGHAVTPHSVASTLTSRYGDCKDKSAVLHHLLKQIGVEAYPVLVATERKNPSRLMVPSMRYFDHVVVCFELEGNTHCLDATDAHTDWLHTPAWIQGKVALKLEPGSEPDEIAVAPFRWKVRVNSELNFTRQGGATEQLTRTYIGEYAGIFRGFLSGMDSDSRREWAVKNYQEQVADTVEPSFEFFGFESLAPEVSVRSDTEFDPFLNPEEAMSYFEHSAWLNQEIHSLYLENNARVARFPGLQVKTTYRFDVGEAWSLTTLTPEFDYSNDFGRMVRHVQRGGNQTLDVVTELEIPEQSVPQREVDRFNRFLDVLVRESRISFAGEVL